MKSQPITDVTSNDVICNGGISPYHTPISQVIINANAGDSITAEWHHTLAGADASDPADPIDPSHLGKLSTHSRAHFVEHRLGLVMSYLARVPDATQANVTGLQWFKIWEDGIDSNGYMDLRSSGENAS